MNTTAPDIAQQTGNVQLLVFSQAGEEYALHLTEIQEIVKTPDITPVPNMPESVVGIANLRGTVVTVIDLEKVLRVEQQEPMATAVHDGPPASEANAPEEPADEPSSSDGNTKQHIIVAEKTNSSEIFGLLVDSATEVLRVAQEHVKQMPDLLKHHPCADDVQGVLVLGTNETGKTDATTESVADQATRMIMVLDLPKVLTDITAAPPSAAVPGTR